MSKRIELIKSGIGDKEDLVVKSPLEVLSRDRIEWDVYLVGTAPALVNEYPAQMFVADVHAKGAITAQAYASTQSTTYRITEYQNHIVDGTLSASTIRPDTFNYTITVTFSDAGTIYYTFPGAVAYEDGYKIQDGRSINEMMQTYVNSYIAAHATATASTYTIAIVPDPDTVATLVLRTSSSDTGTITSVSAADSANYFVYAATNKVTKWKINSSLSKAMTENERTFNAFESAEEVALIPLSNFVPYTDREILAYNMTTLMDSPVFSRASVITSELGTSLKTNEPNLTDGLFNSQSVKVLASNSESITVDKAILNGVGDVTFNVYFYLDDISSVDDRYIFSIDNSSNKGLNVYIDKTTGKLKVYAGFINTALESPNPIPIKEWHRVVVRYNNSKIEAFLDQDRFGVSFAYLEIVPENIYLGCWGSSKQLNGRLDELHISRIVRSDAEIRDSFMKSITPDQYTLYRTGFDGVPWTIYAKDLDLNGTPDHYPAITYSFTNSNPTDDALVYINSGVTPHPTTEEYSTLEGDSTSSVTINVLIPNNSNNVIAHSDYTVDVAYNTNQELTVTRQHAGSLLKVDKITNVPNNNVVFTWKSKVGQNLFTPPALMTTELDDKLIPIIPDLGMYSEPWLSDPVRISGVSNGLGGTGRGDYYQPAPVFVPPDGVTITGYNVKKIAVNGITDVNLFNPASNEAGITASADLVNGEYVDTYTLGAGLTLQETKFTVTPSKQYVLTFNRKGPAHTDTFSCFTADGTDMQKEAPSTTEVGVQNADGICTVRSTIGPFPEGTATCSLLHISNSSSESVILSSIFLTEKTPYTMLQLSSEGSYIRGASDWSTLNVVQQEYVRRKIHTGDPIEGIISEDTQVAQITKITYNDIPVYHYEVSCANVSIEMWAETETSWNYINIWANRRAKDLEKWNPYIKRGHYYFNEEEFYFPSNQFTVVPKLVDNMPGVTANLPVLIENMQQDGAPIIVVQRENGAIIKEYRQVAPRSIDEIVHGDGLIVVYATEEKILTGTMKVFMDGVELAPTDFYVEGNVITKTSGIFPLGSDVRLVYKAPTILNSYIGDGKNSVFLSYDNIDFDSIVLRINNIVIPKEQYKLTRNILQLRNEAVFTENLPVEVRYLLSDSFAIERGYSKTSGNWTKLFFNKSEANIEVHYEGKSQNLYYSTDEIIANPLYSNNYRGFIYLSDEIQQGVKVSVSASPQYLPADGYSEGRIVVTVLDKYDNPVPNHLIKLNSQLPGELTDQDGKCSFVITAPTVPGSITYIINHGISGVDYPEAPFFFYDPESDSSAYRLTWNQLDGYQMTWAEVEALTWNELEVYHRGN